MWIGFVWSSAEGLLASQGGPGLIALVHCNRSVSEASDLSHCRGFQNHSHRGGRCPYMGDQFLYLQRKL